ncbi:MAG TPA: methyltransferase domain-containing protein [Acidimicrobiales bacterium]|nr:methyltransferase domain-containing protein [Acidimicrobiales bacterium]
MAISPERARRLYDRIGRFQDRQSFYEDPAIDALLEAGAFEAARSLVELGCGTGRLAARLLGGHLAPDTRYLGLDVSPRMVALARDRVAPWADRAVVRLADGSWPLPVADAGADRFLATYLLDLLSTTDTAAALAEAHRVLEPGGRLCVSGLTHGATPAARVLERLWFGVWRRWPAALGGCRPVAIAGALDRNKWAVQHHQVVTAWGLSSEVLVAVRR